MAEPSPQPVSIANEPLQEPPAITYADPSTPSAEQLALASGITRGDIAALTVRILGVWVMFEGLSVLGLLVRIGLRFSSSAVPLAIIFVVFEALGVLMILKAVRLGAWLLPKPTITSEVALGAGWPVELQSVAFAVVGIVMAAEAVPAIAFDLWRNIYDGSTRSMAHDSLPDLVLSLFRPAVQLLIGVWLFFGSKRLSLFWRRIRAVRPATHEDAGPL